VTTRLRASVATHVGRVRQNNEDSKLFVERLNLFGVADGMGGHQAGEVASAMAVAILEERVVAGDRDSLVEAVRSANKAIFVQAGDDPEKRGMGTTLCAVTLVDTDDEPPDDDEIAWINVGDSRLYLFRDDQLSQLSTDHSLVEDLRATGQLTAEEAAVHPHRNIVTRALGIDVDVDVDVGGIIGFTGDRLLLCSDGLSDEISSDQMASTLRRLADPGEAAQELVRQAIEHGGRDNVTCVVVDVVDDGGRSLAASGAVSTTAASHADRTAIASVPDPGGADHRFAERAAGPIPPSARALSRSGIGVGAPAPKKHRRFTWRVFAFFVAFVVVIAVAIGSVGFIAKRTYYVDFVGSNVAIYQGQPGGLLWIEPTVHDRTKLDRSRLTEAERIAVSDQHQFTSIADARAFTQRLVARVATRDAVSAAAAAATTTTTAPTTTTKPATRTPTRPTTTTAP
jgi:PPM family protein phosphatase